MLCYHHIADNPDDDLALSVHPERFAAHLRHLQDRADVVPLAAIATPGDRARIALTFDDGLADTAEVAAPLLAGWGLPATIFIPTAALEPDQEFWWERLVHLVLEVHEPLSPALEVELSGRPLRVDVRSAEGRLRAFRALNQRFLRAEPEAVDAALEAVATQLGGTIPDRCAQHRKLNAEQIRALADSDAIEIGGHTQTHPPLAILDTARQRREIAGGRRELEALIKRPVHSFAYPYGYAGSFTAHTTALVREAGYSRACTTVVGQVRYDTDRYNIPRYQVCDWEQDEFAARLEGWLSP